MSSARNTRADLSFQPDNRMTRRIRENPLVIHVKLVSDPSKPGPRGLRWIQHGERIERIGREGQKVDTVRQVGRFTAFGTDSHAGSFEGCAVPRSSSQLSDKVRIKRRHYRLENIWCWKKKIRDFSVESNFSCLYFIYMVLVLDRNNRRIFHRHWIEIISLVSNN